MWISDQFEYQGDLCRKWMFARCISKQSLELKTENDVVRFSVSKRHNGIDSSPEEKAKSKSKRFKMSKRAKVNQLKLYRLMARKKMNSPNPEVRIRYKLEKVGQLVILQIYIGTERYTYTIHNISITVIYVFK